MPGGRQLTRDIETEKHTSRHTDKQRTERLIEDIRVDRLTLSYQ